MQTILLERVEGELKSLLSERLMMISMHIVYNLQDPASICLLKIQDSQDPANNYMPEIQGS